MQSLSYIGPSTWNKLSNNLKTAASINCFKYDIKKYFLNKLSEILYNAFYVSSLYTYFFFLFFDISFFLKDHNGNKAVQLFCAVPVAIDFLIVFVIL